jgi:predicted XRE-type DNA-binding protein
MKRSRIHVRLSLKDRQHLEKILNSRTTTRHDKLKAEVILLTDVGEHGPKISNLDVLAKLNISSRSLGRIKETYSKNSSIEDLFRFTGLSEQTSSSVILGSNSKRAIKRNTKYVEIDDSSNESFLIEHVKCRVTLTKKDREYLETIINEGRQSIRKFNRAKILLLADEGIEGPAMTDKEIAEKLDVSVPTVGRVRRLLITKGQIDEVLNFNHHNAGRPPKVDGVTQATLVAQACSAPPEGRCKWTVRLLADRLVELEVIDCISHTTVANVLKKMNLSLGSVRNG